MTLDSRLSTRDFLGALASLSLAFLSIRVYERDLSALRRAERFFSRFTLDIRRPLDFESLSLSPSGDWAAGIAASSSLSDATEGVSLSRLSPRMRRVWLDSAPKVGDELAAAEELVRQAIAARPGWANYQFLLGELVYVRMNRQQDPDLALHPERWALPLRCAAAGAPGDDWIWRFLAGSYLETWQVIPDSARPDALEVLKRGFLDSDFVSSGLTPAILLLGRDRALALVPDAVLPLEAAFSVFAGRGDIEGAFLLRRRLESAERAQRREDLAKIDERFRLGDREGLRAACDAWVSSHSILEFDDPAGRREVARVLERWPSDDPGSWDDDPRAAIVRFFLDGRERDAPAKGLERAVAALSGVPDYVRARALLLSGDRAGAEEIARRSPAAGSFEWTQYLLDLARASLLRGDRAGAREALARMAPDALGECGALIVQRDAARAAGDGEGAASIERELTAATGLSPPAGGALTRVISTSEFSPRGSLSLCLDPERTRGRKLFIDLRIRPTPPRLSATPPQIGEGTGEGLQSSNRAIEQSPSTSPTRLRQGFGAVPPLQVEREAGPQIAQSRNRAISQSLVSYGWDGGTLGTFLLRGRARLELPLSGLEGRRVLTIRAAAGAPIEPDGGEIR